MERMIKVYAFECELDPGHYLAGSADFVDGQHTLGAVYNLEVAALVYGYDLETREIFEASEEMLEEVLEYFDSAQSSIDWDWASTYFKPKLISVSEAILRNNARLMAGDL